MAVFLMSAPFVGCSLYPSDLGRATIGRWYYDPAATSRASVAGPQLRVSHAAARRSYPGRRGGTMFSSYFWKATAERAVKAFAQSLLAILGAGSIGLLD